MKIKVTNTAKYSGKKDIVWTEEKTGQGVLNQDLILVHKSHKKIPAFSSGVETCVYAENDSAFQLSSMERKEIIKNHKVIEDRTHIVRKDNASEYVYTMKLPAGTFVEIYDNEYRFIMNEKIEIELIGTMGSMIVEIDEKIVSIYGSPRSSYYTTKNINVFTKKY